MPQFRFHFWDGTSRHDDDIGLDLPDAEAAFLEGVAAARSMGSELMTDGINPGRCRFEITDADGAVLFSLAFSELFDRDLPLGRSESRAGEDVRALIEQTHDRAVAAKTELAASIARTHATLAASRALILRLGDYAR